jgi:hypothetical protein
MAIGNAADARAQRILRWVRPGAARNVYCDLALRISPSRLLRGATSARHARSQRGRYYPPGRRERMGGFSHRRPIDDRVGSDGLTVPFSANLGIVAERVSERGTGPFVVAARIL